MSSGDNGISAQISAISTPLTVEAQEVTRLRQLEDWLMNRSERIKAVLSFEEVLPSLLEEVLILYDDALFGLMQITRAYMADNVAYSRIGYYGNEVLDIVAFARFFCHKPIAMVCRRSDVTPDVIQTLAENILCPHELYEKRDVECTLMYKVEKIAIPAQRDGVKSALQKYQEFLKFWCLGPFEAGMPFRYDTRMKDRLRSDLNKIRPKISRLKELIRVAQAQGMDDIDGLAWDPLDDEPPAEDVSNSPSEQLMILWHRLFCTRKILDLTGHIEIFRHAGLRNREVEAAP